MNIKIYTTPTCPYCHQAKAYFTQKKLSFEEIDVSQNQDKAEEMVKVCMPKGGQIGVPVIVIGSKVIIGFDEKEIEKIIG